MLYTVCSSSSSSLVSNPIITLVRLAANRYVAVAAAAAAAADAELTPVRHLTHISARRAWDSRVVGDDA